MRTAPLTGDEKNSAAHDFEYRKKRIRECDEIVDKVRAELRNWPIYQESDNVFAVPLDHGGYSIGYWKGSCNGRIGTHFDLNTIKGVLYLLTIEIVAKDRGQGHGKALYKIMEDIGRALGCYKIEQTPSGTTTTGESRLEYVRRLGYTINGFVAFKELK